MTRAVAIVGRHPRTRDEAPFDNPRVDVWVFNDFAREDWVKRKSAVFEMHPDRTWLEPTKSGYIGFHDWLRQEHPFPIWMLERRPELTCRSF